MGSSSSIRHGACLWLGLVCSSIHFLYDLAATKRGVIREISLYHKNSNIWKQQQQQQLASPFSDEDDDDLNDNSRSTMTTNQHRSSSPTNNNTNSSDHAFRMTNIFADDNNNNGGIGANNENLFNFSSSVEKFKFPSVRERVEYYMGDWFHGINNDTTNNLTTALLLERGLCRYAPFYNASNGLRWYDLPYIIDKRTLRLNRKKKDKFIRKFPTSKADVRSMYFQDAWDNLFRPYYDRWGVDGVDLRVAMMFGDANDNEPIPFPIVLKTRHSPYWFAAKSSKTGAATGTATNAGTMTPILALLRVKRHYDSLANTTMLQVVPWEQKKNILLWRGASTGERIRVIQRYANHSANNNSSNPNNTLMDLGFTSLLPGAQNDPGNLLLLRSRIAMQEQLQFKYLLSLEGNDVASGLKWMLYSNSVVFMARPTVVSWAMEDKLVPFVHYVPVESDFSNLPQMTAWARNHDAQCRRISKHATEYVIELYASPQAQRTNNKISRKIAQRYHALYGPALAQCNDRQYNPYNTTPCITNETNANRLEACKGFFLQPSATRAS